MRVGLIGLGYWGNNLAREIHANPNMKLSFIVEPNEKVMPKIAKLYPSALYYSSMEQLTPKLADLVFVSTPPQNHAATLSGLRYHNYENVVITKPYCLSYADADDYRDMIVLVDYTFLFSNAVKMIPEYLKKLGKIHSIYCRRGNLGKVQECGVQYDLLVHDLSILLYLGFVPDRNSIKARFNHLTSSVLMSAGQTEISIQNSWLSHAKTKEIVFVCENGTLVYDDNENDKIRIYNSHIEIPEDTSKMQYKYGDVLIPYIPANNPLGDMVEEARKSIYESHPRQHQTVGIATYIHTLLEEIKKCQ